MYDDVKQHIELRFQESPNTEVRRILLPYTAVASLSRRWSREIVLADNVSNASFDVILVGASAGEGYWARLANR